MAAVPKPRMTVSEFLAWSQTVPGRYELYAGVAHEMQSERAGHVRKKAQ